MNPEIKLPDEIRSFWDQVIAPRGAEQPLIIAVSGGVDSLSLLHALVDTVPHARPQLTAVTFDHGLRPESRQEAVAVEAIIKKWGVRAYRERLPIKEARQSARDEIELVDTAAESPPAAKSPPSVETIARQLRYERLAALAAKFGSSAVLVGHHADDQVESILMHIIRGSGLHGLVGMRPVGEWPIPLPNSAAPPPVLMRPLLGCWRSEIVAYAREAGLQPIVDPSNRDESFRRNRFRHGVIPLLATINPQIKQTIVNLGEIAAADVARLDAVHDDAWQQVVQKQEAGWIQGDLTKWRGLPLSEQRAIARRALTAAGGEISFKRIEQTVNLLKRGTTGQQSADNSRVATFIFYHHFFIGPASENVGRILDLPQLVGPPQPITFQGQGGGEWPLANGWRLTTAPSEPSGSGLNRLPQLHVTLPVPDQEGDVVLRGRQPGDFLYFRDDTAEIHKTTLKSFFINQKIPRPLRQKWPLIARGSEILWVVGLRVGADVSGTDGERHQTFVLSPPPALE